MARKTAVTARIAPTAKKALEELADANGRSLGQYMERILLAHLDDNKPEPKRGRPHK